MSGVLAKTWYTAMIVLTGAYAFGLILGLAWRPGFAIGLTGILGLILVLIVGLIVAAWRDEL